MGLHQTEKYLYGKGNNQKMKRQAIKWQKMFTNDISDKGLISKIYEYKKCKLIDTETRLVTARGGG